jgi:hypothetical protein
MQYIVNEDGVPIDGHRAKEIRRVARMTWARIAAEGLAPAGWATDVLPAVSDLYRSVYSWMSMPLLMSLTGMN